MRKLLSVRLRGASGSVINLTGRLGRPLPPKPAPEAAFNRNWYQVPGLRSERTAPTFVVFEYRKRVMSSLYQYICYITWVQIENMPYRTNELSLICLTQGEFTSIVEWEKNWAHLVGRRQNDFRASENKMRGRRMSGLPCETPMNCCCHSFNTKMDM